jgi:hypothetical protein
LGVLERLQDAGAIRGRAAAARRDADRVAAAVGLDADAWGASPVTSIV